MDSNGLEDALQTIDVTLRELAVDTSERAVVYWITQIHEATTNALKDALQRNPAVPDSIRQEILHGRPNFPSLIEWMQTYFPHVVDDTTARMLKRFNEARNRAVHPGGGPAAGASAGNFPRAAYLQSTAQSIQQMLERLRQPETATVEPPRKPRQARHVEFPGQHADETVIFKLRRHWLILVTRLIPTLILLLVMAGVGAGIGLVVPVTVPAWVALIVLLSLVPLGLGVWQFLDWENDHYILTDERVLHIERVYFLFEAREEASLGKIQDVTVQMPSFIANALYFGDVQIETAGTGGQINFNAIPKPRKAQRLIFKQAGLPEPGTDHEEQWEKSKQSRARLLRPLETFTRMLYAITPQGGDVKVWRKHWYVLLGKVVRPLLVALLLLIVWIATLILELPASLQLAPEIIIKVIPGILFLLSVGWIIWVAIDWHNDLYVLTDTHVIDIEKRPFTMEFRREANLGMIQNVSYKQPGFIPKLLNFGNTELETAGTLGKFTFDNIPDPRGVQEEITGRLEEFRKRQGKPAPRTEQELVHLLDDILAQRYGAQTPPQDRGQP